MISADTGFKFCVIITLWFWFSIRIRFVEFNILTEHLWLHGNWISTCIDLDTKSSLSVLSTSPSPSNAVSVRSASSSSIRISIFLFFSGKDISLTSLLQLNIEGHAPTASLFAFVSDITKSSYLKCSEHTLVYLVTLKSLLGSRFILDVHTWEQIYTVL